MYKIRLLVLSIVLSITYVGIHSDPVEIKTLYASDTITEPVLVKLLSCPSMRRLREINQYGVSYYVKYDYSYNRYEHSVGVMMILRRFGATLQEQIAGLLHDVSHTIWSHVGDHLFKSEVASYKDSYQDMIIRDFIYDSEIASILYLHGFRVEEVLHKNGSFLMLEQDLPNLCADRIEYNLYGGFLENIVSESDVSDILDHLSFAGGLWFFDDVYHARLLGNISLYLTEHLFTDVGNQLVYDWAAEALRRALRIDLISLDDIHHATDDVVWNALRMSDDNIIQKLVNKMMHYTEYFVLSDSHEYDKHILSKFRGVDPWVQTDEGLQRLTALDRAYCQEYNRVKQLVSQTGYYVKFVTE